MRFRRQEKMTFLSSKSVSHAGYLSVYLGAENQHLIYMYVYILYIYIYCFHELYTQPLYSGEILYSDGAGADRAKLEHT